MQGSQFSQIESGDRLVPVASLVCDEINACDEMGDKMGASLLSVGGSPANHRPFSLVCDDDGYAQGMRRPLRH